MGLLSAGLEGSKGQRRIKNKPSASHWVFEWVKLFPGCRLVRNLLSLNQDPRNGSQWSFPTIASAQPCTLTKRKPEGKARRCCCCCLSALTEPSQDTRNLTLQLCIGCNYILPFPSSFTLHVQAYQALLWLDLDCLARWQNSCSLNHYSPVREVGEGPTAYICRQILQGNRANRSRAWQSNSLCVR